MKVKDLRDNQLAIITEGNFRYRAVVFLQGELYILGKGLTKISSKQWLEYSCNAMGVFYEE